MGIIYCARNKVNGMCYIGQTTLPFSVRISAHKTAAKSGKSLCFWGAIREFGFDAFEWIIVFDDVQPHEMDDLERDAISVYCAQHPNGYNVKRGGILGCKHSEETKLKLRGPKTEEHLRKIRTINRNRPPATIETRRKISEANKGQKRTKEFCDRVSEANRNRPPISEETSRKMSEANRNRAPISEETRRKIGEASRKMHERRRLQKDCE